VVIRENQLVYSSTVTRGFMNRKIQMIIIIQYSRNQMIYDERNQMVNEKKNTDDYYYTVQ
jgi:hypothetical protein